MQTDVSTGAQKRARSSSHKVVPPTSRSTHAGSGAPAATTASAMPVFVGAVLEGALDVATVAAEHGITPRYLHELFEGSGESFARYVLRQRLESAYRRLMNERFGHLSISAIAQDVGFHDLSHFNRSFRRRFARTPSDARPSAWQRRARESA